MWDHTSDCKLYSNCNSKTFGCGFSRGSPHSYFQCKACQVLSLHTLDNIVKMHYFGPYGNFKDLKVNAFVGVPLLKLSVDNSTLCGVGHVRSCMSKAEFRPRQESRSTTLSTVNNVKHTYFDRSVGFVLHDVFSYLKKNLLI